MNTLETLSKSPAQLLRLAVALPLVSALLLGGATVGAAEDVDSTTPDVAASDGHQILPNLVMGGNLRLRAEDRSSFQFGNPAPSDDESFTLHRLRLNMTWTPTESITFFFEGQDSGIHAENDIDDEAIPSLTSDRFDLHQGYMDYRSSVSGSPYRVRIGRQEITLGAERLVSPLDWANTARVTDGVRMTLGMQDDWTLDLFATRYVPVRPSNFNDHDRVGNRHLDSDFHGIYYSNWKLISNTRWDAYLLLRDESRVDDKVWTLGTHTESQWGKWDADFELAYQWGDFANLDHTAWMLHVGGGYSPDWMMDSRFGVALNWATGDDDILDGDHETFDNLYPLGHAHNGYMDFFSFQNMQNLEVTFETGMLEKGKLRVAWHMFWLDEAEDDFWYNANMAPFAFVGAGAEDDAGNEINVTFQYPFWNDRIVALVGYGHFFVGDYIGDTLLEDDDADWFFIQAELNF